MFINIDDNHSIDSKGIITILDFQLLNSSEKMRTFIDKHEANDLIYGNKNEAKSIIITNEFIYYSPISTFSLKKKLNRFSIINKLQDFSTFDK